jgi:integrase/recombinase XerD
MLKTAQLGKGVFKMNTKNISASKIATSKEVKNLLKIAKLASNTPQGKVDYVAIVLMVGAGLRIAEVADLKAQDCDLDAKVIIVRNGKGNKRREVVLASWVKEEIGGYLASLSSEAYLFSSNKSKGENPCNTATIHRRVKALMELAGCRDCVSAHSLRHSYATHALRSGISLACVRDMLGHSSISVTSQYLHIIGEDVDRLEKIGAPN